jgi:hypothetical protein
MCKSEAGNQFDFHISTKIIDKVAGDDEALRLQLEASIGRVFDVARQIKEDLLDNESVTRTINIPGLEPISVTLTVNEIADAIRGQVKDSLQLAHLAIRAGLITGMDRDRMSGELQAQRKDEFIHLSLTESLSNVNHFVMAGGMVQMPLLQKLLVEGGVDDSVISMADNLDPGLAIAKGLGTDSLYKQMNLHVPSFSFIITWLDEDTGTQKSHELYKAHTRLAEVSAGFLGSSDFTNNFHFIKSALPRHGVGEICAMSLNGQLISFDLDGEKLSGIKFRFGFQNEPVLKLTSSGTLYVKDMSEYAGKTYRLDGWPVVRGENGSITLRNQPRQDHREAQAGPDNNFRL